ncbi:DUF819 family protein [Geofilum sp. OHC36d9]|uniref:DUF819 family protein n=1 Tax=Geofilum sp. OHC36d9 TaxID=3458413 RepID=UPI004034E4F2
MKIALTIFYFLAPFLVLHLCHKFRYVNKLGAVVVAYIIGLLLGNLHILPANSQPLQDTLTAVTIPLAIPLMLFSTNLKQVFLLAKKAIISLFIGLVSVIILVTTGYFIFNDSIPETWKMSGLLVGVYTGGTPNLASLKLILNVDEAQYLMTHSADLVIGVLYLFFLMSAGQRLFNAFLSPAKQRATPSSEPLNLDGQDPYYGILKRKYTRPLSKALLLSLIVVAISYLVSLLVPQSAQMAVIMLMITTLSLTLSFWKPVRSIPKTFDLGMYFVLVFSVVVASMVNVTTLTNGAIPILFYVGWVVFGSLILQLLLSRWFGIDADTVIITSAALLCSPPFVPVVAGALRNRSIVVPGLTIGIVGYTIGNYLGFLLAQILKSIPY